MYLYTSGEHGDEDGSDNGQLALKDEMILRIYLSFYLSMYLYARGDHGDEDGSDNTVLTLSLKNIYLFLSIYLCIFMVGVNMVMKMGLIMLS